MKLNLDNQFVDLTGVPLPVKMDDTLANMLAMATIGPPAKMITWAVNLTNEGEIEVDKTDVKFLKGFIEQHPGASNLVKAQLIEAIERLEQPMKSETVHTTSNDPVRDIERKLSNLI
jgi:activator of HSP90 ATPase